MRVCPCLLPVNNSIYNLTLFRGGLAEINASSLNALMPHQIGKECNIIAAFQKALCKAMTERVRIDHLRINTVLDRKLFQLTSNTSCGNTLSTLIQEDKSTVLSLFIQPLKCFLLQRFRNVDSAELTAL